MGIVLYPYYLTVFWYREFLPRSVKKSGEVLVYVLELISVPLLISSFFKPLKSEYRDGLVLFSIMMGIFVKTLILFASSLIIISVLSILVFTNITIAFLPLLLVILVI